jgi:hypothetical protein
MVAASRKMPLNAISSDSSTRVLIRMVPPIEWPTRRVPIVKPAELFLESYLPARILGVGFVWHLRVADFIARPEFSPEVFDELVVPIRQS